MRSFPHLCLLTFAAAALGAPLQAQTAYSVDKVHSSILFRVMHKQVAWSYGRFNEFDGTINVDAKDPAHGAISIEVDAASIDTGNADRDEHLRQADFFNAREFPKITFKSTKIEGAGDKVFNVTGDLSLLGETKPVTARVEITGQNEGEGLAGALATFSFKRSDFGLKYGLPNIGDDVDVIVAIEAKKGN